MFWNLRFGFLFSLVTIAWSIALPGSVSAQSVSLNPRDHSPMLEDARLHDVWFVDPLHGWAVGDRGVVWHTDDGGQNWTLQPSGHDGPLYSVFFLDSKTGWAAGGRTVPLTHRSEGVILVTRDGGASWARLAEGNIPALQRVRFFDAKNGWALGRRSSNFRAGVIATADGGRTWRPLNGAIRTKKGETNFDGWATGDMIDPNTGAVAGESGLSAVVRRGTVENDRSPRFGLRNLHDLRLLAPQWGWLVGDGGLLLMTTDLGMTWQTTAGPLPSGIAGEADFYAVEVRGPRAWVVGSPGSFVLSTEDAGQHWSAFSTGVTVPLYAVRFVDDRHGWAVGAMGTIVVTEDGGRNWKRQRSGGTRAAWLGLFADPNGVPWEWFAHWSAAEGYLSVLETLTRPSPELVQASTDGLTIRAHEAAVGVGASDSRAAWAFPDLPSEWRLNGKRILENWDRANDRRALQKFRAELIRTIRTWRPEVVVTHDIDPYGKRPKNNLINQAVLEAVNLAADPTSHIDQITGLGLEPWEVKKVYGAQPVGVEGSCQLSPGKWDARLGRSPAEMAAAARGLVQDEFEIQTRPQSVRLLLDRVASDRKNPSFFGGIFLEPGGEARRRLLEPVDSFTERRIAASSRNLRAILDRVQNDPVAGNVLLSQAVKLTEAMDHDRAARTLAHLAKLYKRTGRWDLTAETLAQLVERYPKHPMTDSALIWLVHYYGSAEAGWLEQGSQRKTTVQSGKASRSTLSIDLNLQENRLERAAGWAKQILATRPDLYENPSIRFPLTAIDRQRGYPGQAERYLMLIRKREKRDAWWECATGEAWIADRQTASPKSILRALAIPTKPRLDGRLNEPFWAAAAVAELTGADSSSPGAAGKVRLVYDREFLYLAVECANVEGVSYTPVPKGPRPRDGDLSAEDRVELLLDIDRDYATYFRLVVDRRGWTGDDCWGQAKAWDPSWFVARRGDEKGWTVEAAIPLEALTGRYPEPGEVWGIGLRRIMPGAGFQAWNSPEVVEIRPESFGYLLFTP